MVKKYVAFGLLTASLVISPTVVFAQQGEQEVNQEINQRATAIDGKVTQRASQKATQSQRRRGARCAGDSQSQLSRQRINQDGFALNDSRVDQRARQLSDQRQRIRKRGCY
ncbi:MAG: hypothetical protein QNJ51_07185 [Calothrix sp. MO_167.B12]|nr:hypothetical protein [Calothrix sp. MO_167.B12]